MKRNNQNGFTLIELLIVVVIIGILAALAIPSLLRARIAAENRSAIALLSTMRSSQLAYYAQNSHYANFADLEQSQNGSLGITPIAPGTTATRGNFTYNYTTASPNEYFITAVRNDASVTYTMEQDGVISHIVFGTGWE